MQVSGKTETRARQRQEPGDTRAFPRKAEAKGQERRVGQDSTGEREEEREREREKHG